jgi:hypothetical protein
MLRQEHRGRQADKTASRKQNWSVITGGHDCRILYPKISYPQKNLTADYADFTD